MNARNVLSRVPSLIGMIVTLAVAYGLDILLEFLTYKNAQTFAIVPLVLWTYPAANLLLAVCLLLLFWYVNSRAVRSRFVSVAFLVIGLFLLIYTPATTTAMMFIPTLQLPDLPVVSLVWGRTNLAYACAGIAIMGLLGLLLRRDTPQQ